MPNLIGGSGIDFVKQANAGSPDGPTELRFEYRLVLARKRG